MRLLIVSNARTKSDAQKDMDTDWTDRESQEPVVHLSSFCLALLGERESTNRS